MGEYLVQHMKRLNITVQKHEPGTQKLKKDGQEIEVGLG